MTRLIAWLRRRTGLRLFLSAIVLLAGAADAIFNDRPLGRAVGVLLAVWGGFNTALVIVERERDRRKSQAHLDG